VTLDLTANAVADDRKLDLVVWPVTTVPVALNVEAVDEFRRSADFWPTITAERLAQFSDADMYHRIAGEMGIPFEQIPVEKHMINAPDFLKDGLICRILFHADEEKVISCELPQFIEAEITYTEPGIKGDTATNTLKPATIDTGVEIRVPLFIGTGDFIKVDTKKKEYSERVKK